MERIKNIKPLDLQAMKEAENLQNSFIKPAGSLGELERISIQIAGITGRQKNKISRRTICLFGADNGIYDEGVCSSPQNFTRLLMQVYAENQNAGINILSRQTNSELKIFDLGVKGLKPHKNIITHKFMSDGTADFLKGRAMPLSIAEKVISFGIDLVRDLKSEGFDLIGTGEVGMGNTTTSCACIMAALKSRDDSLIGRGAGLDDSGLLRKKKIILEALNFHAENLKDPVNILSCVGGLDIAAITGIFLGGAIYRVPVIIDGVISIAGALMAYILEPLCRDYMFASHESSEPAYIKAADFMNINAPLKMSMRLGEGTGCALFMQIIDDSLAIINNMGNFNEINT